MSESPHPYCTVHDQPEDWCEDGHASGPPCPAVARVIQSPPRCECTEARSGRRCASAAVWLVRVGTRHTDAQLSCGLHLNRTCQVMLGAEGRSAALTVTPASVPQAPSSSPRGGRRPVDDIRAQEGLL